MISATETSQTVPLTLKLIIQSLPEFAYAFSKEGKLLAWNKNIELGLGYSKEELNNLTVLDFTPKHEKEKALGKFSKVVNGGIGEEQTVECNLQPKLGKVFPVIALRSLVVIDGKEYLIGIAINKYKVGSGEENIYHQTGEIKKSKDQLEEHYRKIEEMKQAEILLNNKVFFNSETFNSKLINSLPGIFYVYEKEGDSFFLKKWNKNYTTDLGYPDDEVLNMQPHQFFNKKELVKVEDTINKIFKTGLTQTVEVYTTHKSGKQIPYYYEGYHFEDEGRVFFMGLGIDISSRYALQKKQKSQELRERKTNEKLNSKERELITTALEISKTNKIIDDTLININKLLKKNNGAKICDDLRLIKNDLKKQSIEQNNWEVFKLRFTEVHKDYFRNLKVKHPTLTKSDLKFCAYLKINLSSSQISSVLNVTNEAIKKSRYRIRKKIGIHPKESLEEYLEEF